MPDGTPHEATKTLIQTEEIAGKREAKGKSKYRRRERNGTRNAKGGSYWDSWDYANHIPRRRDRRRTF